MGENNNQQLNRMRAATNNSDRNRWRKMGGKNRNVAAFVALIIIALQYFPQPVLFHFQLLLIHKFLSLSVQSEIYRSYYDILLY